MTEFNLSEKIKKTSTLDDMENISTKDVKEFITIIKKHFTPEDKQWMNVEMFSPREIIEFIEQKAGDRLK